MPDRWPKCTWVTETRPKQPTKKLPMCLPETFPPNEPGYMGLLDLVVAGRRLLWVIYTSWVATSLPEAGRRGRKVVRHSVESKGRRTEIRRSQSAASGAGVLPPLVWCVWVKKLGVWGGVESMRQRAESQWIVAARPLCHLQYPVAYLSRLQRIQLVARLKLRYKAILTG